MPAYTVSQLASLLGEYIRPGTLFTNALAQVLPRLYNLGIWRDLVFEVELDGSPGYFTLPTDADSLLACTINDTPRPARQLWQDVKISGRHATMPPVYGVVDDGYYPVLLDMKDVQGVDSEDDIVPVNAGLFVYPSGTTTLGAWPTEPDWAITITATLGGAPTDLPGSWDSGPDEYEFESTGGYDKITSITYADVDEELDLYDSTYNKVVATIPKGSGVLRLRRFRCPKNDTEGVTVHALCKRACPTYLENNTIVHLGNLNALKHGLLAVVAEDNADVDRASYHWGVCEKLLDDDLRAHWGQAKAQVRIRLNDGAAQPLHNFY